MAASAVLLTAVACKSPEERSDGSGGTAAPSTELGRGVDDESIKVGVMYYDFSNLQDVLPTLDHGDYESAYQALATSINDDGGIDGRTIELVFATMDPVDQSTATTACAELIEDEEVFAVLAPHTNDTAASCVLDEHATPLIGGVQTAAALDAAQAPWFTWDAASASAARDTVAGVIEAGDLDGETVAVVAGPSDDQVANDVADQLAEADVDVAGVAVSSPNLSDPTAARAEMQTFAERFRSDGADTVVVINDAFVLFAQALQQSDYRPQLVATSTNAVKGHIVAATDHDVLGGLVTGGPPDEAAAFAEPPAQDCVERIRAVEPDRTIDAPAAPKERVPNTFVSVVQACKGMDLFAAIAADAGETLNADTFGAAGESLGEIELPMLGGPSDYSAEHPDGRPPTFLAEWDDDAEMLVYSSTPVG